MAQPTDISLSVTPWHMVVLAAVVLLSLAFWAGWAVSQRSAPARRPTQGRRPRGSSWPWMISIAFGVAISAVLAAVTIRLTVDLATNTAHAQAASPVRTPEPAAAAASASAPPAGESGNKNDSIVNAMTATGTAVAVLALILSLGTTWFAGKQKELDEHLKAVSDALAKVELRERVEAQRTEVLERLPAARMEAFKWVARPENAEAGIQDYLHMFNNTLEQLTSGERRVRFLAFTTLIEFIDVEDTPPTELPLLREYAAACEELAWARAELQGLLVNTRAMKEFASKGIWCNFFDVGELDRWKAQMSR